MRLVAAVLFLAGLAAGAPGCSPGEPHDPAGQAGTHTISLDGESVIAAPWRETVTGRALFAPTTYVPTDGARIERIGIQLQDARTNRFILLSLDTFDATTPAPGTYAVTADERGAPGAFYVSLAHVQASPSYTDQFEAEGGSVTITASSASRIAGEIDLTMRTAGFSAPGGQVVRVTGTFAATPGR